MELSRGGARSESAERQRAPSLKAKVFAAHQTGTDLELVEKPAYLHDPPSQGVCALTKPTA